MKTDVPQVNEASISYQLRRSERAKKTRIVVSVDKIEVVAPLKVSEQRIKAFVYAQQDWIERALNRVRQRSQNVESLAPTQYSEGVHVPYQGRLVPLSVRATKSRRPEVSLLTENQLLVALPSSADPNKSDLIRHALQCWMRQQAHWHARLYIERNAARQGLLPRSLKIKTQKSRWGSCGPNNDINLNWLLMLAPPVIMEYVVIHELCHIRHKNHSPAFWQLVDEHMPDYQVHRHWLKQHGASLMRGL